jgi:hypothetical protein
MIDFAAQHVPFEACFNFRDIGGYPAAGGMQVRRGRYYRSGGLQNMSASDIERARGLGLTTVLDLRFPAEVSAGGGLGALFEGTTTRWELPVLPDGRSAELDAELGPGISGRRYLGYLATGKPALAKSFELIANPENHAVVIHCTAGKDRTGIHTALVLDILGVDDGVIAQDYALTNVDTERWMAWLDARGRLRESATAADYGVPPGAIAIFLDGIREQYGSATDFASSIGVSDATLDALRDGLLEPVDQG